MTLIASSQLTIADYFFPVSKFHNINFFRDIFLVKNFSIFLALYAQVSFHIPYTTVSATLQTLGILLTGVALGSRRSGLAILTYLVKGAAGMSGMQLRSESIERAQGSLLLESFSLFYLYRESALQHPPLEGRA